MSNNAPLKLSWWSEKQTVPQPPARRQNDAAVVTTAPIKTGRLGDETAKGSSSPAQASEQAVTSSGCSLSRRSVLSWANSIAKATQIVTTLKAMVGSGPSTRHEN